MSLPLQEPASAALRRVYRWDLDKTYLQTDFDRLRDLLRSAIERAEAKQSVPGAAALLRELRRGEGCRVCFISGSPRQMRRVLTEKLRLDGVQFDEFILKPNLSNLFRGRFRALREQVGYKLAELLEGRLRLPPVTREVLLGDDTEMDAYAYTLYRDAVRGALSADRLATTLVQLGVDDDRRAQIASLLPEVRALVRPGSGVLLIGIRETDRPNHTHPARRVAGPGIVFHRDSAALAAALAAVHAL